MWLHDGCLGFTLSPVTQRGVAPDILASSTTRRAAASTATAIVLCQSDAETHVPVSREPGGDVLAQKREQRPF